MTSRVEKPYPSHVLNLTFCSAFSGAGWRLRIGQAKKIRSEENEEQEQLQGTAQNTDAGGRNARYQGRTGLID